MNRPVAAALAAIALNSAVACHRRAPEQAAAVPKPKLPAPLKVETAAVERLLMPRFLTLTGSVLADRQSEVAANVAGRITTTGIERGQPVKQGEVLAVVDSKAAGFSAAAAEAQLRASQTQVRLAAQDCDRAEKLFAQGSIARAEYERLRSQCEAQLYQGNAARANASLASKLAGDTVIRAPIDGVVGERFVSVGEYVQASSRVASLYAIDPARVSISVPEPAIGQVKEGQTLEVEVSAWPERKFPAVVKYVSPALRPNSRDLIVEAVAANPERALRPGMFATVKLRVGEEELPTVPADALRVDGTVKRVFLARQGFAFEMVVRTGESRDGRVAVLESLEPGALVIRNPPPGLQDGAAVQ